MQLTLTGILCYCDSMHRTVHVLAETFNTIGVWHMYICIHRRLMFLRAPRTCLVSPLPALFTFAIMPSLRAPAQLVPPRPGDNPSDAPRKSAPRVYTPQQEQQRLAIKKFIQRRRLRFLQRFFVPWHNRYASVCTLSTLRM